MDARMLRNSDVAWGDIAKWLHWTMAPLILVQVPLGLMAAGWRLSPAKLQLFFWHKSLGVLILALLVLRVAWRLANPAPGLPGEMPAWERAAAHASHALLYALMALLPLTGWIVNAASGIPLRVFGLFPLPALVEPNETLARLFTLLHRGLVVTLVVVLVAHVAAALRHHWILRDAILARMLPWNKNR